MRWHGAIGYSEDLEIKPGVWKSQITERHYYGEILKNNRRVESVNSINDNVMISNRISVIADSYAMEHMMNIRYIEFMGGKMKINSLDIQLPRLIIELGGVYNGG